MESEAKRGIVRGRPGRVVAPLSAEVTRTVVHRASFTSFTQFVGGKREIRPRAIIDSERLGILFDSRAAPLPFCGYVPVESTECRVEKSKMRGAR